MALNLSAVAKLEKIKISSDGAWLVLLEIKISETQVIRVVRNTEDIEWNGLTWYSFPFDLEDITEDSQGEIPTVTVKVSNVTKTVQRYIEETNGAVGANVTLYVVHSKHLDYSVPEIEESFTVRSIKCDPYWVSFTLSGDFPTLRRIPETRYLKDYCPFKFRGIECGYKQEDDAECNKTLDDCRKLDNSLRFGGEPSIPEGGSFKSNPL